TSFDTCPCRNDTTSAPRTHSTPRESSGTEFHSLHMELTVVFPWLLHGCRLRILSDLMGMPTPHRKNPGAAFSNPPADPPAPGITAPSASAAGDASAPRPRELARPVSLRSPLGKVLGVGSAKSGVQHWWVQRLTAVALVPLSVWFVVSLLSLPSFDHATVVAWMSGSWTALLLILLVLTCAWHSQL